MSMMVENYLLQALQTALSSVQSSPGSLADILTGLSASDLASAEQWFVNTTITIAYGAPTQESQLPFIGVNTEVENQLLEQTGVGLLYADDADSSGQLQQERGNRFNGMVKATIYAPDTNSIQWLYVFCKWAMLSQFDWFGSDDGGGFNNLSIMVGSFEPLPSFMQTGSFVRGVYLCGEYDITFITTPQTITSIALSGTIDAQNGD